MKDSEFWRALSTEFRALDPSICLHAYWISKPNDNSIEWKLFADGDGCDSVNAQFKALAMRAGIKISEFDSSLEPLTLWLVVLKASGKGETETTPEGFAAGSIFRLCEASAAVGSDLEAKALIRERVAATKPQSAQPESLESFASQIDALRAECRLTVEELAEAIDVKARSVYRHLKGVVPRGKQLRAYEREFSQRLERKVVLSQTSSKRQ
jgi:DNA-binding transcriptional ArsR family regulator